MSSMFTPKKPNTPGLWRNSKGQLVFLGADPDKYHAVDGSFQISADTEPVDSLEDDYWEKAEFPARITNTYVTNPTPEHTRKFLRG